MAHHSPNTTFVPYSTKELPHPQSTFQRTPRRSLVNPLFNANEEHEYKFQRKQKFTMKSSCIQGSSQISKQSDYKLKNSSQFYQPSQIFKKDAGSGQTTKKQPKLDKISSNYFPRSQKSKLTVSQIFTTPSGSSTLNIIQSDQKHFPKNLQEPQGKEQNDWKKANFKKFIKQEIVSSKNVPSFILKRKEAKENSCLVSNVNQKSLSSKDAQQSCSYQKPLYKTQKQGGCKEGHTNRKCSIEQNVQPNPFDQYQKLKLSYPKATASTISSQLQSYQSLKNLHDLDDLQQFQMAEKSMEYCQTLPRIMNRAKTYKEQVESNELQDQFNDLFGNDEEQQVSQELNSQIASQLLSLF